MLKRQPDNPNAKLCILVRLLYIVKVEDYWNDIQLVLGKLVQVDQLSKSNEVLPPNKARECSIDQFKSALNLAISEYESEVAFLIKAHERVEGIFKGTKKQAEAMLADAIKAEEERLGKLKSIIEAYKPPQRPHEIRWSLLSYLIIQTKEIEGTFQFMLENDVTKNVDLDLTERLKKCRSKFAKLGQRFTNFRQTCNQDMGPQVQECLDEVTHILEDLNALELELGKRGKCWYPDYEQRLPPSQHLPKESRPNHFEERMENRAQKTIRKQTVNPHAELFLDVYLLRKEYVRRFLRELKLTMRPISWVEDYKHDDILPQDKALECRSGARHYRAVYKAVRDCEIALWRANGAYEQVVGLFQGEMRDQIEEMLAHGVKRAEKRLQKLKEFYCRITEGVPKYPHEIRRDGLSYIINRCAWVASTIGQCIDQYCQDEVGAELIEKLRQWKSDFDEQIAIFKSLRERCSQKVSGQLKECVDKVELILKELEALDLEPVIREHYQFPYAFRLPR